MSSIIFVFKIFFVFLSLVDMKNSRNEEEGKNNAAMKYQRTDEGYKVPAAIEEPNKFDYAHVCSCGNSYKYAAIVD